MQAAEPPVIPIGEDAYLQWHRWPQQRIGARAYMRSTYDRRGGNEGADASHFLYQEAVHRTAHLERQPQQGAAAEIGPLLADQLGQAQP